MQEERATLSRFDDELKSLERAIKDKKEAIQEADLKISQWKHDITSLEKDKVAASNAATNLEKQYDWIVEDQAYVVSQYFTS